MSLHPPISQRDVDEGTLFVTRLGEDRRIVGHVRIGAEDFPWVADNQIAYGADGRYWHNAHPSGLDLITRKESHVGQVVVKDERTGDKEGVRYKDLPPDSLFTKRSDDKTIFLKCYSEARKLTHICGVGPHWVFQDDDLCIPRPDLRLELVLKNA